MKEIHNLAEKNAYFREIDYNTLTSKIKDKILPLLIFMIIKRSGELKTRSVAAGNRQRLYTDKTKYSSLMPNFYSLKYLCAIFANEDRDMVTVDLPDFFSQIENEGLVLLKIIEVAVLLLVELNINKWKKYLRRENGK